MISRVLASPFLRNEALSYLFFGLLIAATFLI